MKKMLLGLSVAVAVGAAWAQTPAPAASAAQQAVAPVLFHLVGGEQGRGLPLVDGKVVINNRGRQSVCWHVTGLPASQAPYTVIEYITSPAGAEFHSESGGVAFNPQQTEHTVKSQVSPNAEGFLGQCWGFGRKDPVGDYSLSLEMGGYAFPAQSFKVTK